MLNRRDKRRYLAIWNGDHRYDRRKIVEAISTRSSELFGQIATEKARIRFIGIDDKDVIIIISCRLELLGSMLSTIVLMQPPIVLLSISGTLKALRTRMERDAEKFLSAFLSTTTD
jgi:RNase P/RNase MRP subunit POP5